MWWMSKTYLFRVEPIMSDQRQDQTKSETKPEKKKTDATTILSPEELRAISGGTGQPVNAPKGPSPNTKGVG
jgi:hypothetical protein